MSNLQFLGVPRPSSEFTLEAPLREAAHVARIDTPAFAKYFGHNIHLNIYLIHFLPYIATASRYWLAGARKQPASKQILLWNSPTEAPKALQASECSELLGRMEANCWIFAQH